MNIVEPILFQARNQPSAPALCAQGIDVVSYSQLVAQIYRIARRARSLGLGPGSVTALSVNDPLLHAALILGLTFVGIVPVSVAGNQPPPGLKIDAVISNAVYPFAPEAKHLLFDDSWTTGDSSPLEATPAGAAASDAICRIVLTSGTTGDPKAVALSHKLVLARCARSDFLFGNRIPAFSRIYIDMGLAASRGYYFLIRTLGRGGTLFFRGDSVENTLRSFEVFRIEAMMATPHSLARLLTDCDQHPSIGVHFDTIVSGGSLLTRQLAERVHPRLCTHLITSYGATETTVTATAAAHRIVHIPGACGYLTPGARIEVVDEHDRPVPAATEGIVRVASELAVDRYVDDPVESARVFRDGWVYTGDVGSLTADNLLIITGRQNNVLNIGGGKMAAEKLEAALRSYAGVSDAAVLTAVGKVVVEEVWAGIVCGGSVDLDSLKAYCRARMPTSFVPAHIVAFDSLPLNIAGKVDRSSLKQMLAAAQT